MSYLSGGKRKLSKWNKFVQKVYTEQHRKNKNFQFKDALKMASAMKKKGQYGGSPEDEMEMALTETFDASMPENEPSMTGGDDGEEEIAVSEMSEIDDMQGGRRRRRTRRRRHSSRRRRGRTHRRRTRRH